jgi:predicted CXXCH cytochrome family protein
MTCEKRLVALPASLLALVALWCTPGAWAVEHPGTLEKGADCSTCHAQKMMGRSVHSAMQSPCTVCHVTSTQGDMTTVSLSMPKNKICYACHEESAALRQHVPAMKGPCVDCHDAHSSQRRMLLREESRLMPGADKKK